MSKLHCVLDASALLKKYREETGSDLIKALFNRTDCAKHILNVTIPEVTGAFVNWRLHKEIEPTDRENLIESFINDIRLYNVVVHNITHRNIVKTDDVWTKSITVKPSSQPELEKWIDCPLCKKSFVLKTKPMKLRVGPIDILVLSVCLELRASYGNNVYLFSSDGHMLKVANKLNIKTCDPEAIMQLPF